MATEPTPIPPRIKLIGRLLNATLARMPWLWPLLRAPMRSFFDSSARGWDERTGAGSVSHLAGLAAATALVEPDPERVLDLGTGTGESALFLAREFPRASVRGVDLSEEMIRAAQHKIGLDPDGRVAFRVADAAALAYDDDTFDLVTQVNLPPFFAEIARVLRPSGHVIIVASLGADTPFYTPPAVLERGLRRRGIEVVEAGATEGSTWLVGRAA